ncbi:MAG: vWA domain-containing protein [Nanoarchaeota archaeon]
MYFTLESPYYLYYLMFIPLIILVYIISLRKKGGRSLNFANIEAIQKIKGVSLVSKNIVMFILFLILISSVIFALSELTLHTQMNATSFSYVLAIDASSSMSAEDIFPSRLGAAKEAALNFVDSAPIGTRIGVISFSGTSQIKTGLSEDTNKIKFNIRDINQRGVGGTNFMDALTSSVNLLRDETAKSVILISDGKDNVRNFKEIVDYARNNDVVVHTMGVGTEYGKVTGNFTAGIERDQLKALSHNSDGNYYNISNSDDLTSSFEDILNTTETKISISLEKYLLIFSVFLIFIIWFLYNNNLRIIP